MKKLLFFPFHPDIEMLIKWKNFLKGYEISGFLSFIDDETVQNRILDFLDLPKLNIDEQISDCDAIIILENYRNYFSNRYGSIIHKALEKDKEILVTVQAKNESVLQNFKGKIKPLELNPVLSYEQQKKNRYFKSKKI